MENDPQSAQTYPLHSKSPNGTLESSKPVLEQITSASTSQNALLANFLWVSQQKSTAEHHSPDHPESVANSPINHQHQHQLSCQNTKTVLNLSQILKLGDTDFKCAQETEKDVQTENDALRQRCAAQETKIQSLVKKVKVLEANSFPKEKYLEVFEAHQQLALQNATLLASNASLQRFLQQRDDVLKLQEKEISRQKQDIRKQNTVFKSQKTEIFNLERKLNEIEADSTQKSVKLWEKEKEIDRRGEKIRQLKISAEEETQKVEICVVELCTELQRVESEKCDIVANPGFLEVCPSQASIIGRDTQPSEAHLKASIKRCRPQELRNVHCGKSSRQRMSLVSNETEPGEIQD